jgi:hypothetical protein
MALGIVLGVAVSLLAFAIVRRSLQTETVIVFEPPASPVATASAVATATPVPIQGLVTREVVAVTLGPGSNFAILGTLAARAEIERLRQDQSGSWTEIRFPPNSTGRGWVPSEVVVDTLTEAASVSAPPVPAAPAPQSSAATLPTSPPQVQGQESQAEQRQPPPGSLLGNSITSSAGKSSLRLWELIGFAMLVVLGMPGLTAALAWLENRH